MNSKISLSPKLFIMNTMETNIVDVNAVIGVINKIMASICDFTICQQNRD